MCKALTIQGYKCSLGANKDLCHIHSNQYAKHELLKAKQQIDILTADAVAYQLIEAILPDPYKNRKKSKVESRTISSKTPSNPKRSDTTLIEIHKKHCDKLEQEIQTLKSDNENLLNMINNMKPNYLAYETICKYETFRRELQQKNIDPLKYTIPIDNDIIPTPSKFHKLRKRRNQLAHA